jgi:hypothetical protein
MLRAGGPRIIGACLIQQQAAQFWALYLPLLHGVTAHRVCRSYGASTVRNHRPLGDSQGHSLEILCNAS